MANTGTRERILSCAAAEFSAYGFQAASLRRIVREAGVTTGAFYGYFESKEAVFAALVDEPYRVVLSGYRKVLADFDALPKNEQPENMGRISGSYMQRATDYMLEHKNAFRLLLSCADGTRYESMREEVIALEVAATHRYYETLEALGNPAPRVDEHLEHMLVTGMFNAYFEIILHDMTRDAARNYLRQMHEFYIAGWKKLTGA